MLVRMGFRECLIVESTVGLGLGLGVEIGVSVDVWFVASPWTQESP